MLSESSVKKHACRGLFLHYDPTSARILVLRINDLACAFGVYLRRAGLPALPAFIPVGCEVETVPGRNECYCAHAFLYLMVEMATPNSIGSDKSEISRTPMRNRAI